MAWPLTRYIDFFAGTVPEIAAAFLNSLQDVLGGIFKGTLSLKAVVVDGAGGAASTPVDGTVFIGTPGGKATVPTTAYAIGTATQSSLTAAWIRFMGTGTIERAYNIYGFTRVSAGLYTVTLPFQLAHPICTCGKYAVAAGWDYRVSDTISGGKTVITIATWDAGGVAADIDTFHLVVHGDN